MKKHIFWKVYAGFVAFAVIVSAVAITFFWNYLKAYEKSQPRYEVENVLELFKNGNTDELMKYMDYKVSSFETEETVRDYVNSLLGEGDWMYTKDFLAFSEDSQGYIIKKNSVKVATITIKKSDKKGSFNTAKWQLVSVSDVLKSSTYTVTAPSNATVSVNGIKLDASFITENNIAVSGISNVTKYTSVPGMVKYTIPELIAKPKLTAVGGVYGNELASTSTDNYNTQFAFESNSEFIKTQETFITELSKKYSLYVTNDLSFSAISSYIKKDSSAYSFLKTIANANIWYAPHSSTNFVNMSVHDAQIYSSECYSCEVSYTMQVVSSVASANKVYEYPTNLKYYFVKSGNSWYVADMMIK